MIIKNNQYVAYCTACERVAPEWIDDNGDVLRTTCIKCGVGLICVDPEVVIRYAEISQKMGKGGKRGKEEISFAGGKVSSSKQPSFKLIPTIALVRLANVCDLGIERKGEKAWNALSRNQEVLEDKEFILERISHVIGHAFQLRDKILAGNLEGDDDSAAIMWGGMFLCCATEKPKEYPKLTTELLK